MDVVDERDGHGGPTLPLGARRFNTPMNAESWVVSGERVPVALQSGRYEVFVRIAGEGPWLTLLHAFPTSSWDWSRVAPVLEQRFSVLALDFLGLGDSDKPHPHEYSIDEQAGVVEALWERFEIHRTGIVAHDYGATVAQELLARSSQTPSAVVLLNAALFAELARPLLIQRLLARRRLGPLLAQTLTERAFARSISSVSRVSRDEIHQQWQLLERRNGRRAVPSLLGYLRERRENAARWERALEETSLPLHLIWGMTDPRSGARVTEHVLRRIPSARLVPLEAGHYPQLEAPDRVSDAITNVLMP
jgi:pimeloyl-ACP methyl ester carboxylesterase